MRSYQTYEGGFSKLGAGQSEATFGGITRDISLGIAPSPYGQKKLVASQHDTPVILKRIERDCLFCYREYSEHKGRRSTTPKLGNAGKLESKWEREFTHRVEEMERSACT